MNRALLKKSWNESRWLLLACAAALFAFCWLRVWIVSQLDTGRFKAILDLLPGDLERFSSVDFAWLVTYPGRISLTYSEPIVILCISIWAIARGSDCVSGELGRGTMELLLAQPVSRLQVLLTPAFVTVVGIAILVAIGWAGTYVGIQTTQVYEEVTPTWSVPLIGIDVPIPFAAKEVRTSPMSAKVSAGIFLTASINLFSLGFFLGGLSTLLSSCDRYRWRTIGLVVGIFVVQLIVKIVGLAVDELEWLRYVNVLTAYDPEALVKVADQLPEQAWTLVRSSPDGPSHLLGPLGHHLILAVSGSIAYAAATVIFCRRDLPAPL